MGRLRFAQWVWIVVTISLFVSLPACGGHTPPGVSRFPTRINLNPAPSFSIQAGTTILFTASAGTLSNGTSSGAKVIAVTNSSGVASVTLTLPSSAGAVTVTAEGPYGLGHPVAPTFTETAN